MRRLRHDFVVFFVIWSISLINGFAQDTNTDNSIIAKKNVVLILGDDAGFEMGAYNNTACKTPNFDKLASRGVTFDNAFTTVSSCSPSRSALLTGLPPHQNGMFGLHDFNMNSFSTVKSLPMILHEAGIRTGIVGKKHLGPDSVYKFDYEQTEENNPIIQVGRNITLMKQYVQEFLSQDDSRPFFLYIAYHDPHRCSDIPTYGQFCERFGNGEPGMGNIPDWTPVKYSPDDVTIPFFLPNTTATRDDMANMYTAYSRMDQGLGLFMELLEKAGVMNDTLVVYSSDNGIPFPGAKTNLYDPGMREPLIISSPLQTQSWGSKTDAMASLIDIVPTVLDWYSVKYPTYRIKPYLPPVVLTGKSLLPVLEYPSAIQLPNFDAVFSSHNFHEITMYFPMRVIRTAEKFKLIHNLNMGLSFPIATDLYQEPSFQEILNNTKSGKPTYWYRTLGDYYHRAPFELYDLNLDPKEQMNLCNEPSLFAILDALKTRLRAWQNATHDPWYCYPGAVLERTYCGPLYNGEY
ncbi:N-sulphoglucosamine sulphohydrolase-like [Haliotis cracherodii]|uniref:N-sulphoglucosamine sulphohydrolase-like n=1 Tax=Haliotis cracherodii TaxID=6455 RepID=UPI0039E9E429